MTQGSQPLEETGTKHTEHNVYRDEVIECIAEKLKEWYPDHSYISVICAAVRSMKSN